ncbi:MAG: diguanylate cyclase [Myxococcaceae bacterium]
MDIKPDAAFELKLIFLKELDGGYRAAREHHDRLLKNPSDSIALKELWNFFHKIAGTAQSVDLTVLGYLSAVSEDLLRLAIDGHITALQKLPRMLSDALAGVAAALDNHGGKISDRPLTNPLGLTQPDATGEERVLSKVLIIDDDPFSAKLIDNCLRDAGLMSSFCCDPGEALQTIMSELPDLIVLDVQMPGVDGFDVCRRVRAHPALQFTPVNFVTRRGDLEQRVRGLEVGGNDYISKPFEPQELVARVRSHLQRLSELRNMAIRDGLTRCYNHKYFKARLEQEISRARRYRENLTLGMVDVDFFKTINDTHGHPAGDAVLAHLSNLVVASVRSTDVVARYGGEEFGILFVQAGATEAAIITNRLRERIAKHRFALPTSAAGGTAEIPVTVSIGVAQFHEDDDMAAFLSRADSALYDAKRAGRNQVKVDERGAAAKPAP